MVSFNDIKKQKDKILDLAKEHGASNIRVFGSYAYGTPNENSDLDLLVTMAENRSLLDRIGLMYDLQDLLHVKVDVVNEKALHKLLKGTILNEAIYL